MKPTMSTKLTSKQQRALQEQQALALHASNCQFWLRSLGRNDAELAALIDLNASLKAVKDAIVVRGEENSDESLLLDLGAGIYRLAPDGRDVLQKVTLHEGENVEVFADVPETEISHDLQQLCVDFLLRRKLRRRLISRLCRRLNRIGSSMDADAIPEVPPPPKYGELRLVIDPENINAYEQYTSKRITELQKIQKMYESGGNDTIDYEFLKEYQDTYEHTITAATSLTGLVQYTVLQPVPTPDNDGTAKSPYVPDYQRMTPQQPAGIGALLRNATAKEKEAEYKRWQTAMYAKIPDQPTLADLGLEHRIFRHQERRQEIAKKKRKQQQEQPDDSSSSLQPPEKRSVPTDRDVQPDTKEQPKVHSEKEDIANEEDHTDPQESDMDASPHQAPLPETGQLSTELEEVIEEDWELVGKKDVPPAEQDPEEKCSKVDDDAESDNESSEMESEGSKMDEDDEDDDEEKAEDDTSDDEINYPEEIEEKKDLGADKTDLKQEPDDEQPKQNKPGPVTTRIIKPISLAPIPSFYEQDLRRIKVVQADLMAQSMEVQSRKKLVDVTSEYNHFVQKSMGLVRERQYFQNQMHQYEVERQKLANATSGEYALQVAIAKNDWMKRRRQFEHNKLNAVLPSRHNRMREGTLYTRTYTTQPDPTGLCAQVGDCLADIVDAVENDAYGRMRIEKFREPLVLPPNPVLADPSSVEAQKHHLDQMIIQNRKGLNNTIHQLNVVETERERAWKRYLKVKCEAGIPHDVYTTSGMVRRIQLDQSLLYQIPMPPLHKGVLDATPNAPSSRSNLACYTPNSRFNSTYEFGTTKSTYSPSKIKQRLAQGMS